jgi:hypothetical protein
MMNLTHAAVVTSALRGCICAGLATVITAFFSWSFVASTDAFDWMGSSALDAPEMAMIREDNGPQPKGA